MRILVTNDDGVAAPGLAILAECARAFSEDVWVVAPADEKSGVGSAITLNHPLRVEPRSPRVWSVNGTPVDCVFMALGQVCADKRPDLVLSGINRGPNLGHDVFYSGTVGAAREAQIQGIPALAFSLMASGGYDYAAVAPAVARFIQYAVEGKFPSGPHAPLLNINIPTPDPNVDASWAGIRGIRGVHTTSLGRRFYNNELIIRDDPRGNPYTWIGGSTPRLEPDDGTDCGAILNHFISVTPLGLDLNDHHRLSAMRADAGWTE